MLSEQKKVGSKLELIVTTDKGHYQSLTTSDNDVLSAHALEYARHSKSENTKRAYKAAWRDFEYYAKLNNRQSLPASPETIIEYVVSLTEAKVSTIEVRLAAISSGHRMAGLADPTTFERVKLVVEGIRRTRRTAPDKKAPITHSVLEQLVATLPTTLRGKRDRAILLVGYAGAFRRSELVALDVQDLQLLPDRITVTLRHSKTDQEGAGMVKIIPEIPNDQTCPACALREWLLAAQVCGGAIFRRIDRWGNVMDGRLTDQNVARIIKRAAQSAGLDPAQFSGHSLRSGFITEAANAGVESRDIMAQTGHKSETVMRGYIQDAGRGAMRAAVAALGQKGGE